MPLSKEETAAYEVAEETLRRALAARVGAVLSLTEAEVRWQQRRDRFGVIDSEIEERDRELADLMGTVARLLDIENAAWQALRLIAVGDPPKPACACGRAADKYCARCGRALCTACSVEYEPPSAAGRVRCVECDYQAYRDTHGI